MTIDVNQCPGCGMWQCVMNDHVMIKADERGPCERMARILDSARNRRPREAMRMLCEEIGYGEKRAKEVLHLLHGGSPTPEGRLN